MDPTTNEPIESLRARLQSAATGKPSRDAWTTVCGCLEQWPPDASRDEAVTWADGALEAWPHGGIEHRVALGAPLRAHGNGAPLPAWWPLVRHLQLEGGQPIAPVTALLHVRSLSAQGGDIDLSPLLQLTRLRRLDLSRNEGVLKMPSLAALTELERLTIANIPYVLDLDSLADLPRLKTLTLGRNPYLTNLAPLRGLATLETLDVSGCNSLADLSPLASLTALRELRIDGSHAIADLSPLTSLGGLRTLWATNVELKDFGPIRALTGLTGLTMGGRHLADLGPVASLTQLEWLQISDAPLLRDLAPLTRATALRSVSIAHCPLVADYSPLRSLPALEQLHLGPAYADASALSSLGSRTLRELRIHRHGGLRDIGFVRHMPSLEEVAFTDCDQLEDVSLLATLPRLKKLVLIGSSRVTDLGPVLNAHPQLEVVR